MLYFCSFWKEISTNNSVLLVSQILRLFDNILRPNEKYCLSVKASVSRNKFKCNHLKTKKYFINFFCISAIYINFEILWTKRSASEAISFWNYRLQKARLLKCLKSPVSEHLWTVNMLKGPNDCINLHGSVFFYISWSLRNEIRSKNFRLVISEIFRLFFNILTPDENYCLSVKASV